MFLRFPYNVPTMFLCSRRKSSGKKLEFNLDLSSLTRVFSCVFPALHRAGAGCVGDVVELFAARTAIQVPVCRRENEEVREVPL